MTASEKPDILASRRRRGGVIPGMEPAPPSPAGGAGRASDPPPPVDRQRRERSASGRRSPTAVRFAGARKTTVSMRSYGPLWHAYGDLVRDVSRDAGVRVFQADLVNAVLATCIPKDAVEARECLDRYRALLEADPPGDLRVI